MAYTPKLPPLDPCPVEHVMQLIGGKWKARLLALLREQPRPVADLQRCLPRARAQVLLQQLKALERADLVQRLPPAHGRTWGPYALTDRAASLLGAVDVIAAWGDHDLLSHGAP